MSACSFISALHIVKQANRSKVAGLGLKSNSQIDSILEQLNRDDLYFSSHRAYKANWKADLLNHLSLIKKGATVLIPRIPSELIPSEFGNLKIVPAENCTKLHLLTLRQLHR